MRELWELAMSEWNMYPDLDQIELTYTKSEIREMIEDFLEKAGLECCLGPGAVYFDSLCEWYDNL